MKRDTDRRHLPTDYSSQGSNPLNFSNPHFNVNQHINIKQITAALSVPNSINKVFDALSDLFDCSKNEICLVERMTVTRENVKTPIILFRTTYNENFMRVLKESDKVKFQNIRKAWNAPEGLESERIFNALHDYFSVVIDLSSLTAWSNSNQAESAFLGTLSFYPMTAFQEIHAKDIFKSILKDRPNDLLRANSLFAHDGNAFIKLNEKSVFWTQLPFLLVRYGVMDGRPRYVSYSTLGSVVEGISFGNSSKDTAKAIAKYIDTCQTLNRKQKISVIEYDVEKTFPFDELKKNSTHGNFERFQSELNTIQARFPTIPFALLCSDYVTLLSSDYGANSNNRDIAAYVHTSRTYNDRYLSKIAAFFGYDADHYPIVFSRSYLDVCAFSENTLFTETLIHELAHHLDQKWVSSDELRESHGISWAILNDLLLAIVERKYEGCISFFEYHPDDISTALAIESAVKLIIKKHKLYDTDKTFTEDEVIDLLIECLAIIETQADEFLH